MSRPHDACLQPLLEDNVDIAEEAREMEDPSWLTWLDNLCHRMFTWFMPTRVDAAPMNKRAVVGPVGPNLSLELETIKEAYIMSQTSDLHVSTYLNADMVVIGVVIGHKSPTVSRNFSAGT